MGRRRRWLSFALGGLAAGWVVSTFFSSPLVGLVPWRAPWWAALCGAVAFGLAGAALDRPPSMRSWAEHVRLLTAVLGAGALAGAAVGAILTVRQMVRAQLALVGSGAGVGLGLGVLSALALLPGFAILSRAAADPGVARAGSLAVRTEQRRAWYVLTGFVGTALLASLPDWLAYGSGQSPAPWESDLVALVLGGGVVVLGTLETAALARMARLERARATMEQLPDPPTAVATVCQSFVDLGVGEQLVGTRVRTSPYRAVERHGAVVYGDVERARAVLFGGLFRAARSLLVIGAVVGCQRLAALPGAALWLQQQRCWCGSVGGCYQAWAMIHEGRAGATDSGEQEQLMSQACVLGIALSACDRWTPAVPDQAPPTSR
jgi:hypothetical protein